LLSYEVAKARAFAMHRGFRHLPVAQRPPASARPAHGGRFSPAGPGVGLGL